MTSRANLFALEQGAKTLIVMVTGGGQLLGALLWSEHACARRHLSGAISSQCLTLFSQIKVRWNRLYEEKTLKQLRQRLEETLHCKNQVQLKCGLTF